MGMYPVKVDQGTHTIHLDPYLYVVFRWMRGAVSLFALAARLERRTKRADPVRMQRNQHSPWSRLINSMATFGIVKVIECNDSGRMEVEKHHVGEWRGLLLIINNEEAV